MAGGINFHNVLVMREEEAKLVGVCGDALASVDERVAFVTMAGECSALVRAALIAEAPFLAFVSIALRIYNIDM